ncbi:MAG: GntR family transcriptional regulator [Ruminococcaceae bacterium]|nr:GntR family transcriptional regulator [Oscillospiraceae bacterium]
MAWVLDKNRPICPQICEQICVKIASGQYNQNERIPSVREIALEAGVNPNTVQKALTILTEQGLLYSMRGSGMYVSDRTDKAEKKINEMKREKTLEYIEEMKSLGLEVEEIKQYIKEWSE